MLGLILLLLVCYSSSMALLSQGDECIVYKTNIPGTCIDVNQCEHAANVLRLRRENLPFCGFAGNKTLVCCPSRVSFQKCCEYKTMKKERRLIESGSEALSREFPLMAAIGYGDNVTSLIWLCGGTLISEYFVMTAAHCTYSSGIGPATYIRLGDLDLKNTTEDASPVDIAITKIYAHPHYKSPSYYHDIALLKLAERVFFSDYFSPACLHTQKHLPVSTLEATGWGTLGFFGESSSHLMKVNLSIVDHETCARRYADISPRKLKNGILDRFQMCAGDSIGGDTCSGDSGGPLHYVEDWTDWTTRYFVVVGITSFGKACGGNNSVGVYTRLSAYVEWIERIVWPQITQLRTVASKPDMSSQPNLRTKHKNFLIACVVIVIIFY